MKKLRKICELIKGRRLDNDSLTTPNSPFSPGGLNLESNTFSEKLKKDEKSPKKSAKRRLSNLSSQNVPKITEEKT